MLPANFDYRNPYPTDRPPEWEPVSEEYAPKLMVVRGVETPEQTRVFNFIASQRWYLIKNEFHDRYGNRSPCKHCKNVHSYMTLRCIERPFHGLDEVVNLIQIADGEYVTPGAELSPGTTEIQGQRLGQAVPIDRKTAYRLIARIRSRGERLYPGLRT